ncbi:MAG: SDR family NAD(P)-dependent oxidoreductase [Anaerolineaceae bacterium]
MELELTGKTVLITGGSEGIGKAAATEFAREGAHVAICARRSDILESAAAEIRSATGGQVVAIVADVSTLAGCNQFVQQAAEKLGGADILVNNAGRSAGAPFDALPDADWIPDIDLKLMAAVRCSQAAIPFMKRAGGGRIINITHVGGKAPGAGTLPSSVSRAAGIALTKAMSKDLAKDNILVNTICVGLIKSGQIERAARGRNPDATLDEAYARMGGAIPLGRVGESREVAAMIAFLASPLGAYITGAAINIDGGMAATV